MQHHTHRWVAGMTLALGGLASGVMYNRDTGSEISKDLANLPPFSSRANIPGCTAVLVAPNVLLSASHCVNYAATGTVTATWNGQSRSGSVFTKIGADHMVIVTSTPFTGTLGKMTAPYSGSSENGKLAWKVASGGNGVIGYGGTGPFYDGLFRGMTNRIEVNNVSSPPPAVTSDWLYYDFDSPPSRPISGRPTTFYEGGTAPGDSGGPLYMFENGRWYVIGVTSGPDAGFYRDGRVRTDMSQIESTTGHVWARPTVPALEMKWVAQDMVASLADGAAITNWPRQGGADAWLPAAGSATLAHNATPAGTAAVDFPGSAKLELPASSNPVSGETAFSVAMVVRVDAPGIGGETQWFDNTGLIDGDESGEQNDWGLALSSTGKAGLGIGKTDATQYGSVISDGQWHVVVATWDGAEVTGDAAGADKNMAVYVDSSSNVSRKQGAEFLNVGRTGVTLSLGGSRNVNRYLDGRIAEVRLYRGALDSAAVEILMREMKTSHIAATLDFALSKPAGGRAAIYQDQGLVLDGTVSGASPVVQITQTSGPASAVIAPANALPAAVTFPAPGNYQLQIAATSGSSSLTKRVLVEVLPTSHSGTADLPGLPMAVTDAWSAVNIGDASTAGNQTLGSSTASLTGSGMGFEEVSDSHRFVWKPLVGDGSITTRVSGFSANNGGKAYGGIMFRSSLKRESSNAAASVISGGGVRFTRRLEEGAYTEPTTHTLRAPYWVRMVRIGNDFTAYRSEDGLTWTQQGSTTNIAAIPSSAVWGLAVTSHTDSSVSQVVFDNVLIEPLAGQPAPGSTWTGADIGSPADTGSHSISGANHNISGGGSDIWSTADECYYLSKTFSGDARMTARVVSQDRSDLWAKAGVMVRASTAAGSANAFVCTTPGNGLSMQVRATTGGTTTGNTSGTIGFTAPYWLRLTRSGNQFTCFRSTDGSAWSQLGPVETISNAPTTMHAGLFVASLNNNGNSVANFDNISIVETANTPLAADISLASGQNPSLGNNFTLEATTNRTTTWSWQKLSGPGDLVFRTQNSAAPQTAFTTDGTYSVRAIADANGVATFVDQTFNLTLSARWDFNTTGNSEGWSGANPTSPTVANGTISATVTSSDPQIYQLAACHVSGTLAKHLLVRYRSTATGNAQLFWGRVGAGNFSGTRSTTCPYPTANTWTGLILNPSASAEWTGRSIIDLRFDPTGGTNSIYEIDWMAFSDGDYDNDGLTDLEEGGTDLDNDGLPAFEDLDSNNDGLPDSPLPPADVDGDGYPDLLETVRYWNATPRSKTWQPLADDWNTAPLGAGVQGAWSAGDNVVFDRPENYTVSLAQTYAAGQVTFAGGQVVLDGAGSIHASAVTLAAGANLTASTSHLFSAPSPAFLLNGNFNALPAVSPDQPVNLTGSGTLSSGTLRVAGGSFSGQIAGASSLIKETTGTLVLTGSNSFTGASSILTGTLQIGEGGTAGSLGAAQFANEGALVFHRSDAITWAGSMSGGGSLTKSGGNTLTLTGNHTHTGPTIVSGGILEIGNGGTSGSLGGGAVTNGGLIRFNRSDASTCAASISGGTFSKLGAGTLTLAGNNSFGTGTFTFGGGATNVGYLRLAHPKALGNHAKITLASNTSGVSGIELTGGHTFAYAIETVGRNTPAGNTMLRNISGNNTWQGNITITSGGGSYDIESLEGTLVIDGVITASGTQTPRALNVKGPGDVTFGGPLTDTPATRISLTKTGTGTLRLEDANTHVAATTANAGTLMVNGSTISPVAIAGDSTLGGSGLIRDAVITGTSAIAPATISPGDDSVGTLASDGVVTFGAHSRYRWEISDWSATPGSFDQLNVSTLALTATPSAPLAIVITPRGFANPSATSRVFPIATAGVDLTGFNPAAVVIDSTAMSQLDGTWSVSVTVNTLNLVFEPAGYAGWIEDFPGISDASPTADPDGDGWSNHDEWVAGTDPTSNASRFSSTVSTAGLSFTRVPGRSYEIQTSIDLSQWLLHAEVPAGEGIVTVPHPLDPGARRFYRVMIRLLP